MVMSFVLSFFPRGVLDEILNLIESVSEYLTSYSCCCWFQFCRNGASWEVPHIEFLLGTTYLAPKGL